MKKILLSVAFLGLVATTATAQSGTNSPYSRYGLGILGDQSGSFNRGMNGLGLGFYEHNQVNYLNPASYSQLDSLTFIFDAGVSGQITNFKEGNVKKNAKNADFEYAVAGFRAARHLGVSFGVLPFSNVGYNYSLTKNVGGSTTAVYQNTYKGSGGLHQVYLGMGWMPFNRFSIGANISYLWGSISRSLTNTYSETTVNSISKYYSVSVNNFKLDVGAQYTLPAGKNDMLTLGAVYSLGHKLGADLHSDVISTNSLTQKADTAKSTISNGLELPHSFGAGFMWVHKDSWRIGVDYNLQKWSSLKMPLYSSDSKYTLIDGQYMDRQKFTIGGDWCPSVRSRSYLKRVHYRAGVSYATPYYKVNGQDGPKELSASIGFGFPITNSWNNRSQLNISAQWVHQAAKGLITENTFRVNIGFTFNERWFAKWKVE
ncbi:hypothetical protein [Prevotella sp.]|uniref:hypothetical protein n=1 Tax=Prevotella sp. TaxID=59823 RepID=UPI002F91E800